MWKHRDQWGSAVSKELNCPSGSGDGKEERCKKYLEGKTNMKFWCVIMVNDQIGSWETGRGSEPEWWERAVTKEERPWALQTRSNIDWEEQDRGNDRLESEGRAGAGSSALRDTFMMQICESKCELRGPWGRKEGWQWHVLGKACPLAWEEESMGSRAENEGGSPAYASLPEFRLPHMCRLNQQKHPTRYCLRELTSHSRASQPNCDETPGIVFFFPNCCDQYFCKIPKSELLEKWSNAWVLQKCHIAVKLPASFF